METEPKRRLADAGRGEEVRLLGELPVVVERVRQIELVAGRHERGPDLLQPAQLAKTGWPYRR